MKKKYSYLDVIVYKMASRRTAQFLDAQNFIYELNQRFLMYNDMLNKHEAENGKDSTYYILLGKTVCMNEVKVMAEDFAAGKYAPKY